MVRFKWSTALIWSKVFVTFFRIISGILTDPLIYGSSGELINNPVNEEYDEYDEQVDGVGILVPALFIVLEEHGRQYSGGRSHQQDKEGQFSHAGNKGKQVSGKDTRLLDRNNDTHHPLPPGNAHNHGGLFDFTAQLQHAVNAGLGGKGQVFHSTDKGYGYVMALVLILIGVGIMLVNQKVLDSRKSYTTITGKSSQLSLVKLRGLRMPLSIGLSILLVCITVVPLITFAVESFIVEPGHAEHGQVNSAKGHAWDKVWEEGEVAHSTGKEGSLLPDNGITCKDTDGTGTESADHREHKAVHESMVYTVIAKDTRFPIGNVRRPGTGPEYGTEVAQGIIPRFHDERFHGKGNQRYYGDADQ
jgi:hypothetical protein